MDYRNCGYGSIYFADESVPGIDLIMPDAGFIIEKKDDLLGIVLTHST